MTEEERDTIPSSRFKEFAKPKYYRASEELENAVNVSLLTGKPLLVTGEPGTGKTQLAYRMAWEFGMPEPYKLAVKSDTQAVDLFYHFNMVGYFRSAQMKKGIPAKEFIKYNALGEAILQTLPKSEVEDILPKNYEFKGPQRSVVLLDEIDKAPRDFPNDILNELEEMYFRIPELDNRKVTANDKLAPIVVMTSNSEKNLPDAFLRRCIYHHITFPTDRAFILDIVKNRVDGFDPESKLAEQLMKIFEEARNKKLLEKKPSIGELIVWADAITRMTNREFEKPLTTEQLKRTWGILFKKESDIKLAARELSAIV